MFWVIFSLNFYFCISTITLILTRNSKIQKTSSLRNCSKIPMISPFFFYDKNQDSSLLFSGHIHAKNRKHRKTNITEHRLYIYSKPNLNLTFANADLYMLRTCYYMLKKSNNIGLTSLLDAWLQNQQVILWSIFRILVAKFLIFQKKIIFGRILLF